MIFDSHYWPMAFLFAAYSAALTFWLCRGAEGRPQDTTSQRFWNKKVIKFSLQDRGRLAVCVVFVVDLLVQRYNLYYQMPVMTGSFWGYSSQLTLAIIPALLVGAYFARTKVIVSAVGHLAVLWLVPIIQHAMFTWGPTNSKAFADIPNVSIASSADTIPPTDEKHLVQVTPDMAALKAKTAISTKGNYSTRFAVGNLTLQSIKGHRYYAAPLVPNNNDDTFWTPLFGGRAESPGYVLVDAEDKEGTPQLRDNFHITLFEDMPWSMNLERFAYLAGFNKGRLEGATFEVDDNFEPYWTITYVTPAFGNIVGSKVSQVIVINVAAAQPELHAYVPGDAAIAWVDRVISASLVNEYARDWGIYGQPYSNKNLWCWLQIVFDLSRQDTMVPAEGSEGLMLTYTKNAENIWVIPMISQNRTNHGVIGVLVFDTNRNKAVFYPGLRGFNHGGSVAQTMFGAKENGFQKYQIENLELYNIYGHLTWVAIYTRAQALGSTFGAIGFMDAHSQEASDVAYGTSLQDALSDYDDKLANGSTSGAGMSATQANSSVAFDSTIWRIAANGAGWRFRLNGDDKHYFDVTTQVYAGAPLLRDLDHVSGVYMDTHQSIVAVRELKLVANATDAAAEVVRHPK